MTPVIPKYLVTVMNAKGTIINNQKALYEFVADFKRRILSSLFFLIGNKR